MQWTKIVIAGLVEIIWVVGLNQADSFLGWLFTIIFIGLSFYLIISASKTLPVGTVYALFVGIGTVGTVIVDAIFFNQPLSLLKIILIFTLLIGIIGLKLTTPNSDEGGQY